MAVDVGPLLALVAQLADELEGDYGPDVELVCGVIAVELLSPDDDDGTGSIVEHRATLRSTAHVIGLVELVNDSLRAGYTRGDDEDDE